MNDKRDQLYDNLINSGKVSEAEIGNREEFKAAISDEAKARKFYQNIIGSKLLTEDEIGSEDEFFGSISSDFSSPVTGPGSTKQPMMDAELSQQPQREGGYRPTASEMKDFGGTIESARRQAGGVTAGINTLDRYFERRKKGLGQLRKPGVNGKVVEGSQHLNMDTGKLESTYITSQGNEYGSREMAEVEQQQIDDHDRRIRYAFGKGIEELSDKYVNPLVDEALKQADDEWFRSMAESTGVPMGEGMELAALRNANAKIDPEKILQGLRKSLEKACGSPEMQKEIARLAESAGIPAKEYMEQVVAPSLTERLENTFVSSQVAKYMPKNTTEYILRGLSNSIGGMLMSAAVETSGQRAYKNQAESMTQEGNNPYYTPGTGARLAQMGGSFAADAPFFGVYGRVSGQVAKSIAERQIGRMMAKGLSEGTARSIVGASLENSVGARMKNYLMQHIVSSSLTLGGYNATSELTRQIRDKEDIDLGKIAGSTVEGLATGAAFGVTGGISQALSQPLSGIRKVGAKLAGFGAEAETMYATEELAKMAHGQEGFTDPFEGSLEAIEKLGVMKISGPGGLTKAFGEIAHPVKSNQQQHTGVSFSKEEEAYVRNTAEGQSLLQALSNMHPDIAISEVNGKKRLTPDGEQLRRALSDSYNTFMESKETPAIVKQKVAAILGGVYRPGLETGADITHNADGSVVLKTRDKDGNCIREIKFDTFSDAEAWREGCETEFRLNDAVNMWNGTTEEQRAAAVNEVAGMLGLSQEDAAKAVYSALDAKDTSLNQEQYNAVFGAIERNAFPADEYNPRRRYEEGRRMSPEERHFAQVDLQLAEERLALIGPEFAKEVMDNADYADEKMAEIASSPSHGKEEIEAARDYYNALSRSRGMMDETLKGIDERVEAANADVRRNTHPDTGALISATFNGKNYYITAGHFKLTPDGRIVPTDNTGMVILRDQATGAIEVMNPSQLTVTAIENPSRIIEANESPEGLRGQLMKQADDSIELHPETPEVPQEAGEIFIGADGKTYMVNPIPDETGNIVWTKAELDEKGEIAGNPQPLDIDEYRKAKSDEIDAANRPQEMAGENENAPSQGINRVENIPNEGNNRTDNIPNEVEKVPEEAEPLVQELESRLNNEDKGPGNEPPAQQGRIPVDEKGRQMFEQAKPEDTLAELTEKYGEERAHQMISQIAESTARELDKLQNTDTSDMTDMADLAAHEDKIAEARRKADYWQGLVKAKEPEPVQDGLTKASDGVEKPSEGASLENVHGEQQENSPEGEISAPQQPAHLPVPPAKAKLYLKAVEANTGRTFTFTDANGVRSELTVQRIDHEGQTVVTRQDYDAKGNRIGEVREERYPFHQVGEAIISGSWKKVLDTDEELRQNHKYHNRKVGDVPVIDVLTDSEKQQLLDALRRGDIEAAGRLESDLINSHRNDLILRGREIRNEKVDRAMSRSGRGERLRSVRRQYEGFSNALSMLDDGAMEPRSIEEYVADALGDVPRAGNGFLAYESYEKGGNIIIGLKDESGFGKRGFSGDTKGFNPWLAPKGKGISLKQFAEQIHESLPEGMKEQFSDQDIRNIINDVMTGAEKPSDISNYILKNRLEYAEAEARHEEDGWMESPSYQKVVSGDSFAGRLERAEQQTETEPTEGQKRAGNYRKGHIRIAGLNISIENPKGSVRRGTDADGKSWEQQMHNTYGYIRGTQGADGDYIDVFLSDDPARSGKVYIVQQRKKTNGAWEFDELKVLLGFDDAAQASNAYLSNYEKGWEGMHALIETDIDSFKDWLKNGKQEGTYKEDGAWAKIYPGVSTMVADEGKMPEPEQQKVQVLRGKGDKRLSGMGREFSEVPGGHGQTTIPQGDTGQNRRERELLQGELQVDGLDNPVTEPKDSPLSDLQGQNDVNATVGRGNGASAEENQVQDIDVPLERRENSGNSRRNQGQFQNDNIPWQNHENGRLGKGTQSELQNAEEQAETGMDNGKDSNDPNGHRAEGEVKGPDSQETALRDAVVEHLRSIGVEVSTDWKEGQRILDEYNGNGLVKKMGSRVDSKKKQMSDEIGQRELTKEQQTVVDVYTGKSDNQPLTVNRDGRKLTVRMRQGNEQDAGTKHSLFRHYGTGTGVITADDVMRIPDVLADGERTGKQRGKTRLNVYRLTGEDGTKYTVLTEISNRGKEVFNDFYTNRKAPSAARLTVEDSTARLIDNANGHTNTQLSAQADTNNAFSDAKVQQNTETAKDSERKFFKTLDGHAYGYTYKGKLYIDPRIATAETPVHEYGHLWCEMKRRTAPEEWEQMKQVMLGDRKVQPIIERVRRDYPELAREGREDDFIEEIITQFSGKRGAERLKAIADEVAAERGGIFGKAEAVTAMQRLKNILNSFWEGVARMMGWKYRNAGQIADRMMADMLNGVNPRERVKESSGQMRSQQEIERTLMGVHNISEDKLKKVLKQGGLANPSLAVIDTKNHIHTDYGEISLIPKSSLIDAKKGRNAGTWTADAWTPTYPHVQKRMSSKGQDRYWAETRKSLGDEPGDIRSKTMMAFESWMENGVSPERLSYWYLKERGRSPEQVMYESSMAKEDIAAYHQAMGEHDRFSELDEAEKKAVLALIAKDRGETPDEMAAKMQELKERNTQRMNDESVKAFVKMRAERVIGEIDEYGVPYSYISDYDYKVRNAERTDGKLNVDSTLSKAAEQVKSEGLEEDFNKWLEEKEKSYGVEEWLYNGTDSEGRQKWVRNTLENASRLMRNQGRNGAHGMATGNLIATVAKRVTTLDQIRKERGNLNTTLEEHEAFKEQWGDALLELCNKCGDELWVGEARLQEALGEKNPVGYLKKEYGVELSKEDAELLSTFIKEVRENFPTGYFETKFERPVMLDEFEIAVVPKTTSPEMVKALKDAGLDVRTYDNTGSLEQQHENRRQATMDAVQGRDDIMFQKKRETERVKTFHDAIDEMFSNPDFDKTAHSRDRYDLGDTPEFMKKVGITGDSFSLSFKNIKTHMRKDADHNLTAKEWHELPEAIKKPFLITTYGDEEGRYRLYTSIKVGNKFAVVGIDVIKTNQGKDKPMLEVNRIKTVFGRDRYVMENGEKILAYDERMTPEQEALLRGHNFREYPSVQELSSGGKDTKNSDTLQEKSEKSSIQGLDGYTEKDVTDLVEQHFKDLVGEDGLEIVGMKVIGSRTKGKAREDSDLDVLLEYKGDMSEDGLFNILNDETNRLYIEGIPVDINPITRGKGGTIEQWLKRNADYDKENENNSLKFQKAGSPEPEMTPEERQYWNQWDKAMKKWREKNAIPDDMTQAPEKPRFQPGENAMDYAKKLVEWNRQKSLWQTAPKLEDYRQARDDKDVVEEARENEQRYPDSPSARMRRAAADFQRIRHAMSRQKTYDKATVKAVTDFAYEFMKMGFGDNLTRGEMERILSSVKNATGAKDIRKSVDNIMNILADNYLRNLEGQVVKLSSTKELKQTAQGVEVQGKLELKGQRMIQAFRDARGNRMSVEDIRNRMADVAEKMNRNDEEAPMWEQDYEGLSIALQYAENIEGSRSEWADLDREYKDAVKEYKTSGRSYKAQQELLESIEQAMQENKIERIGLYGDIIGRLQGNISESMQGAKEFVEREKQRIKRIQDMANFDLSGKDMGAIHQSDWKKRLSNGTPARFFLGPLATFEQMLKQFGARNANGEGYLYDYFMRNWMDATDNAYVNEQRAKSELDAKAKEVFGEKVKRWSDLYELERILPTMDVSIIDQGEEKTFKLNQGNLLYIYMADKMADGRMKLRKMGIDEGIVEAIKDFLDPRIKELGDWLQEDYLVNKRIGYNKIHERMFGAPMAAIDNYFPIKILSDARVQEQDVSNMADQDAVLPSTITGSIVKRRKNALPLDILGTDALSLAVEHVEDMERWAAQAEWNKDVNTLLSYTTFRNKVKNMNTIYGSGDQLWNTFADAARMAAGTYRPKVRPGSVDKSISNIAKGVTAAKINFRVYTAFKQTLSAPAFLHDVNLADFVKYSVNPYGSWKWAMENMPVFRKRWESRQVGDTRLMDNPTDWKIWKDNIVQTATRMGMSPNALVDGVTCAVGARAIYESRYKKYKQIGASDEVARKRALQDAEIGYNLTQQSSEGAFVSAIQKDRTVAANMLSVFRNSSMAYTRQWVDAARNLNHRMQKGYKEDSIRFMTGQIQKTFGLEEDQAKKVAEAQYARAARHDVARMLNMMFGVTIAWNLGASLPYLLIGDDDHTKKEMLEDAMIKGFVAGPTEGLAAGNLYSDFIGRTVASEQTRKAVRNEGFGAGIDAALKQGGDYEINPLPLMSDIQGMISKMGYDKYAAAQDVFNICMQSAVGVNPQTFTDMWNACMDYGAPAWDGTKYSSDCENLARPKEIALFIMRLMNAPTSSWRNKYIDELGMNAEDAQKLSYEEMARRYAHYKHWKDAPLMGWLRGEVGRQEKTEKLQQQFDKAVEERMERLTNLELADNLMRSGDAEEKRRLAKIAAQRMGLAPGPTSKKPKDSDWYQEVYQERMQYEDVIEDETLAAKFKNLGKTYKEKHEEAERKSVLDLQEFNEANKGWKKRIDDAKTEVKKRMDWIRDGKYDTDTGRKGKSQKKEYVLLEPGKRQLDRDPDNKDNEAAMANIRKWRGEALEILLRAEASQQ